MVDKVAPPMHRTQHYLPVDTIQKLKRLAEYKGLSMSELFRRALDEYLAANKVPPQFGRKRTPKPKAEAPAIPPAVVSEKKPVRRKAPTPVAATSTRRRKAAKAS